MKITGKSSYQNSRGKFSHIDSSVHVLDYLSGIRDKTGSLGPSWFLSLRLIFSTLLRGGGNSGAVNHSESGRGGQAPLTLCTVRGGYLTWDWAPLATDTLTRSVPKQRNAPAPSLSDSWSRSDSVGASVAVIKEAERLPEELTACAARAINAPDYGLPRHAATLRSGAFMKGFSNATLRAALNSDQRPLALRSLQGWNAPTLQLIVKPLFSVFFSSLIACAAKSSVEIIQPETFM